MEPGQVWLTTPAQALQTLGPDRQILIQLEDQSRAAVFQVVTYHANHHLKFL